MKPIFLYMGYAGTVLLCLSFVPQVYTVYKTKNVIAVSYGFIILQIITCLTLGIYGFGFIYDNDINGIPILIANAWIFICCMFLLFGKIRFSPKPSIETETYIKSPGKSKI